ncbi:MAG: hypothetical protein ACJ8F3_01485 [Xanthobacteraceae bacterium]
MNRLKAYTILSALAVVAPAGTAAVNAGPVLCTIKCVGIACSKICVEPTDETLGRGDVKVEERRRVESDLDLEEKKITPGPDAVVDVKR